MRVGKKIKFILSDLTDKVSSELHSKRFFKSGVMRMCRIPSGLKLGENIHAALRHNVLRICAVRKNETLINNKCLLAYCTYTLL